MDTEIDARLDKIGSDEALTLRGFANVLAELSWPSSGLLTALLAFNLGVELGQIAIVIVVLPILMLAGRQPAYRRVMPVLSLVIAAIGVAWFAERALGIAILPIG